MSWLTDNSWLQINKDGSGYVLAGPGLTEESVKGVIPTSDGFV